MAILLLKSKVRTSSFSTVISFKISTYSLNKTYVCFNTYLLKTDPNNAECIYKSKSLLCPFTEICLPKAATINS